MENEPKEDWGFVVTVTEAKPGCRAGHKVGDRFEFEYGMERLFMPCIPSSMPCDWAQI